MTYCRTLVRYTVSVTSARVIAAFGQAFANRGRRLAATVSRNDVHWHSGGVNHPSGEPGSSTAPGSIPTTRPEPSAHAPDDDPWVPPPGAVQP